MDLLCYICFSASQKIVFNLKRYRYPPSHQKRSKALREKKKPHNRTQFHHTLMISSLSPLLYSITVLLPRSSGPITSGSGKTADIPSISSSSVSAHRIRSIVIARLLGARYSSARLLRKRQPLTSEASKSTELDTRTSAISSPRRSSQRDWIPDRESEAPRKRC